jgi:hypothetical protein
VLDVVTVMLDVVAMMDNAMMMMHDMVVMMLHHRRGIGAADHRSREGKGDGEAERGEKGLLHGHFLRRAGKPDRSVACAVNGGKVRKGPPTVILFASIHVEDFSALLNFVARVFLLDLPQIRHEHCSIHWRIWNCARRGKPA